MKAMKYLFAFGLLVAWSFLLYAQQPLNTTLTPGSAGIAPTIEPRTSVYKKEHIIPEKKPVPYAYIREADVMWAKDVWRTIDLRQRANFPLRYPLKGKMSGGERYSLYGLLIEGIQTEEITPYAYVLNVGWKDPFSKRTTLTENYVAAGGDSILQADGTFKVEYDGSSISQFRLQEQWFFDKQHSVMKVRIIALAPVSRISYNKLTFEEYDPPREYIPFIVYFPQCRRLFATHSIYNPNNDAQRISFDDMFFQRRFSSTIIAESNVYGNRPLSSFKLGQDVLLEAEKIKHDLFMMEHDLWEY